MGLYLKDIRKSYKNNEVLKGISGELENGIYGFLGANGVGKTTLFKIISGYITDFKGEVEYPVLNDKNNIMLGFLPQNFIGYPDMTIDEFLMYLGTVKSSLSKHEILADIDEKLGLFNLHDIRKKKLKTLSGGQLRRVGLAQALLLNPKVIMLDEPTAGLDPTERNRFKNYISNLGHNQTILLSTHIVTDLEFITKKIFIMKDGIFSMEGTEKELIEKCTGFVWEIDFENEFEAQQKLQNHVISMIYEDGSVTKARVISRYKPLDNAIEVKPTLNDVYLINFQEEAKNNVK